MLVFLTIISDGLGTLGGGWILSAPVDIDLSQYFHMAYQSLRYPDVLEGLVKPLLFGFIIATVGCYLWECLTRGGTQGVGRSTTQAVVVSSVLIILAISDQSVNHWIFGRSFQPLEFTYVDHETVPSREPAIGDPNAPVVSFEHVSIGFDGHLS